MIPVLYSKDQTIFVTNGLGVLSDAKSCLCTEVLNGSYELELKMPYSGLHAKEIQNDCLLKVKPNYEDPAQLFRIYSVEKNYDGNLEVKAAHISYDTAGIPVLPFTSSNLGEAVDYMNTNRKELTSSYFVLNSQLSVDGTLEVKSPMSFRSLLGGSDTSIQKVYGGEYHYDNYTINLVEKRGSDKGICFRYGKNILDFEQETNSEEFYTAVWGYWKKSGSNGEADTIIYGNIMQCNDSLPYDKIYILDTSSSIKNENDANATVEQIDECVEKYISENGVGFAKSKMKIDYLDDRSIKICLGDRLGVIYPEYDIYAIARCNKIVFNCLEEKNESIEIGVETKDISDTISGFLTKL